MESFFEAIGTIIGGTFMGGLIGIGVGFVIGITFFTTGGQRDAVGSLGRGMSIGIPLTAALGFIAMVITVWLDAARHRERQRAIEQERMRQASEAEARSIQAELDRMKREFDEWRRREEAAIKDIFR